MPKIDSVRLLHLLGSPSDGVLPAVVLCPCCQHRTLRVYHDKITDGTWHSCRTCKFNGNEIELASDVWKTSIDETVARLRSEGVIIGGERYQAKISRDSLTRRRLQQAQDEFRSDASALDVLSHYVGFRDTFSPILQARAGRFFGWLPKIETGNTKLAGRIVVPFYDLPDRVCGLFSVAAGNYQVGYEPTVPLSGRTFEGGLAFLPVSELISQDFPDTLFVISDLRTATKFQLLHLRDHEFPLPIVATNPVPRVERNNVVTRQALTTLSNVCSRAVFVDPDLSPATFSAASKVDGYVAQLKETNYLQTLHSANRRAMPWPIALLQRANELPPEEQSKFLGSLDLDELAWEELRRNSNPSMLALLRQTAGGQSDRQYISVGGKAFYETSTGIFDSKEKMVADIRMQIDKIITLTDGSLSYYKGVIRYGGQRLEFCDEAKTITRNKDWLHNFLTSKGLVPCKLTIPQKTFVDISLAMSRPSVVSVSGICGWDAKLSGFRLPNAVITSEGWKNEVSPWLSDGPGGRWRFVGAPPQALSDILVQNRLHAVLWAITAVIGAGVLEYVSTVNKTGILLIGDGARLCGKTVIEAWDCQKLTAQRAKTLRHHWPYELRGRWSDQLKGTPIVIPEDDDEVLALGLSAGWYVVEADEIGMLPDSASDSLRQFLSCWLTSLRRRKLILSTPNSLRTKSPVSVVENVLNDMHIFLSAYFENVEVLKQAAWWTSVPERLGWLSRRLVGWLIKAINNRELRFSHKGFEESSTKSLVVLDNHRLFIPFVALADLCYRKLDLVPSKERLIAMLTHDRANPKEETLNERPGVSVDYEWWRRRASYELRND